MAQLLEGKPDNRHEYCIEHNNEEPQEERPEPRLRANYGDNRRAMVEAILLLLQRTGELP